MAQAASELVATDIPTKGTQITVNAAAERYGIHPGTVKNWIYRDHAVRVLRAGGRGRGCQTIIDEHDVAEIVAAHDIGFGYRRKKQSP